ncbi:hypothetical protein [Helicobacter cetorum]|uniref:hypothetical protein n=1 Tax=Helicobacter cetorum TaxID=138563 RepID=UPI000CF08D2A|nr:hypothetical protein [Helicobacter cetorum]
MKKILCLAFIMGAFSVLYAEKSGVYGEVGFQYGNQTYSDTKTTPTQNFVGDHGDIPTNAFGTPKAENKENSQIDSNAFKSK